MALKTLGFLRPLYIVVASGVFVDREVLVSQCCATLVVLAKSNIEFKRKSLSLANN